MKQLNHQIFMELALELATRGRLTVSPNPMVGCVIVKQDKVIAQGYHKIAGGPHAEIHALEQAQADVQDATMYVTLEPCCHQGRTPPCVAAVIKAGIKKVFVACLDPNPLVGGKGIEQLKAHGIDVEVGLCQQEAAQLNEIFFHYITTKRPFVYAKWAMSLDGKTITHPQDDRIISGEESHYETHQVRQQVDAILIGAKTAIKDNPLLTVRLPEQSNIKQPERIIISRYGQLPLDLKLFAPHLPGKTIVAVTDKVEKNWYQAAIAKNIEVLVFPRNESDEIELISLLEELGKRQISSLLVEGGMSVHEKFFNKHLVNKLKVFLAPVIIGTNEKKQRINNFQYKQLGNDFCLTAEITGEKYV